MLFEKFDIDSKNASVYYIFDRDRDSNNSQIIYDLLGVLGNSKDNGDSPNGLLLLSYPCLETFIISCFKNNCYSLEIEQKDIKSYINVCKYNQCNININELENSCKEMINSIYNLLNYKLRNEDLDNFSETNIKLFEEQEQNYETNNYYNLLSLLIVSFIDLGIINLP